MQLTVNGTAHNLHASSALGTNSEQAAVHNGCLVNPVVASRHTAYLGMATSDQNILMQRRPPHSSRGGLTRGWQ
jgi:hypothetical protein